MSIQQDDVYRIAQLARLRIDKEEVQGYAANLTQILELVEQMDRIDTADIAPMAHPLEAGLRLRDDTVTETDRREDFLAIAPSSEQGLYLVPRVIE